MAWRGEMGSILKLSAEGLRGEAVTDIDLLLAGAWAGRRSEMLCHALIDGALTPRAKNFD